MPDSSPGGVALPARMGLGALLIQLHYDVSDREVVQMIQENPYLQYFCGMKKYDSEQPPFDPSTLVHFRKTERGQDIAQAAEKYRYESGGCAADQKDRRPYGGL